jgi:hypothetical protein
MFSKSIGAAILCVAFGMIGPVAAQPATDMQSATKVTETSVTMPDGSIVVTRRETVSAGWTSISPTPPLRTGSPNMVTGGVGGYIGGRDILGVTPPYNVKLPLSMQ